jgi:hypothetical protein
MGRITRWFEGYRSHSKAPERHHKQGFVWTITAHYSKRDHCYSHRGPLQPYPYVTVQFNWSLDRVQLVTAAPLSDSPHTRARK